uniref:Domain of unknown function at the cortex 1 domain-containing protein n=1 Tax=Alexandrium catenella TaxID=2925 RepID=A0A7S1WPW8_ALECA|mmetsp:Transcript_80624/g.214028  ORF Transcript_80624/g.214028 Transcript_80624/m.214028 type:complete len:428 (+) Transcript_80624:116-1399(+)
MCGAVPENQPVWRSLLLSATGPASHSALAVALPLLQLLPAGPTRTLGSALLVLGLLVLWRRQEAPRKSLELDVQAEESSGSSFVPVEDPIRWTFMPSTGVLRANTEEAVQSTNDMADLKFLVLHRPTHEPWREHAREYPYSWHFAGRKRVWEVRVQMRFKRLPKGPIYFGLEMQHIPGSAKGAGKHLKNLLLSMIYSSLGNHFYQAAGDDPTEVEGEAEPSTFAMPLWVVDQFIVSDPAEAPDLNSDLTGLGARRTDGMKKYVDAFRDTLDALSCDKVYTFAFWGISQFLDVMSWEFRGVFPGFKMNANGLCGAPPVYVVAYDLEGSAEDDEDKRHLISKKSYYFKVACWSDRQPPKPEVLQELLGAPQAALLEQSGTSRTYAREPSRFAGLAEANARWRARAKARGDRTLRRLISMLGGCGGCRSS